LITSPNLGVLVWLGVLRSCTGDRCCGNGGKDDW